MNFNETEEMNENCRKINIKVDALQKVLVSQLLSAL